VSLALAVAAPWIAVVILAALMIVGAAGAFLLLAMGRLTLDLGWGRSVHELGPIVRRIAAPRELVFEIINAPYTTRAGRDSGVEVLAGSDSLVVAAHRTKVHFYTARTVEIVEFEPPSRVGFRHLAGPVPHAVEHFTLEELGDGTELRYGGEVGIDFFALGKLAARYWVRPQWERAVGAHLDEVKDLAEERAAAQRARKSHT
jgi:uncharacterized protein YndB with AHSA1/START domain